ncbi:MAG TPA: BPSL0067 family protein [Telluria sp.]|nr:BPSL0067 family protein [Telluria sp.]
MPYIAANPKKFLDSSVGSGQCVAFVQAAVQVGHTSTWGRGARVQGLVLPIGTAIATFGDNKRYENDTHGSSHAAIYLGQTAIGIQVLDQWRHKRKLPDGTIKDDIHVVQERTIFFQANVKPVDDGGKYYVID